MIDPQAKTIHDAVNRDPPMDVLGLAASRDQMARRPRPVVTEIAEVRDFEAGERCIPVRLYRPQVGAVLPLIVFAHGGGWILGSIESADETCRRLALASGCAVLSVEYRLAPEARHPAPVVDMLDVLAWLPAVAPALRVDLERIGIAGESSGAQIAVAAALAARQTSDWSFRAQLLVCPPFDRRMTSPSWVELGDDHIPRRSQMAWMWNLYLGEHDEFSAGAPDPGKADLDGLPPTVIVLAEYDPLHDEGLAFAERLRAAKVLVRLIDCEGQIHPVFGYAALVEACDRYLSRAAGEMAMLLRS